MALGLAGVSPPRDLGFAAVGWTLDLLSPRAPPLYWGEEHSLCTGERMPAFQASSNSMALDPSSYL